MFSTVLILFLSFHKCRKALIFALAGVLIFSGCLYAMALGAPRFLRQLFQLEEHSNNFLAFTFFLRKWVRK